jgi:hypothetical protein
MQKNIYETENGKNNNQDNDRFNNCERIVRGSIRDKQCVMGRGVRKGLTLIFDGKWNDVI